MICPPHYTVCSLSFQHLISADREAFEGQYSNMYSALVGKIASIAEGVARVKKEAEGLKDENRDQKKDLEVNIGTRTKTLGVLCISTW